MQGPLLERRSATSYYSIVLSQIHFPIIQHGSTLKNPYTSLPAHTLTYADIVLYGLDKDRETDCIKIPLAFIYGSRKAKMTHKKGKMRFHSLKSKYSL